MSTRVGDEKMSNDNENLKLMESAPIPKAILTLAIPTVLSMIVSLIYNITDTYFIGLLDDPIQLGAISLAFPVFMIFQALGNMFGAGAPSYISRCLGEKKYEEVKPDLVMMDITMPEMDGIQALKKIKEVDPGAVVVMCSAMGQQAMVIESIQSGAKDFIVKPFDKDRVLEAVKKVIG